MKIVVVVVRISCCAIQHIPERTNLFEFLTLSPLDIVVLFSYFFLYLCHYWSPHKYANLSF